MDLQFLAWEGHSRNADHHGFLWLKGKPGCGKSTIMKLICARANKISTGQIILTYFFNARASGFLEKSSLGLYRLLTHQLLTALSRARPIFLTKFCNKEKERKVEEWTAAELKDFLVSIVKESDTPPISIFIDAIDEGAESDVRDMIAFFEGLQRHAYAEGTPLRICFSSRHFPHITIRAGLEIVIEQQTGHDTDMFRYIWLNLHGDRSSSMDEFRQKVHQKSAGIFLWVVLVLPMINTVFDRGKSLDDASRRLEDIPAELDALLVDILARSNEDIDECISLLQWVTFAMEPLTPEQLYVAILYSSASSPAGQVKIPDHDRIEKYLLHCSRGLVEVSKSGPLQIQFIHETIRGFLLGENGLVNMEPQLKGGLAGISHDKLREACLKCIMDNHPTNKLYKKLVSHLGSPLKFLRYATAHLFPHANTAQRCGQYQSEFVRAINEDKNDVFTTFKHSYNLFKEFKDQYTHNVTPLHVVAEQNLVNLAQQLILHGADVNAEAGSRGGALQTASLRGRVEVVQLLLDRGADVNISGGHYGSALQAASRHGHLQVVQLLLDRGANVNIQGGFYDSALQAASSEGRLEVVQLLLDRGADVNIQGSVYGSALQAASFWGHLEVVQLLLDRGADVNMAGDLDGSALGAATKRGHSEVVKLLLKHGALPIEGSG